MGSAVAAVVSSIFVWWPVEPAPKPEPKKDPTHQQRGKP